jgi:hypothetical protein
MKVSLTDKMYDVLKSIALVWLPAAGTLYFTLSSIWGLPAAEQVVGSITAIDTFLGVGLRLSSGNYSPKMDGHLVVDDSDPDTTKAQLSIGTPPQELIKLDHIKLKVVHPALDSPPIPGPHGGS